MTSVVTRVVITDLVKYYYDVRLFGDALMDVEKGKAQGREAQGRRKEGTRTKSTREGGTRKDAQGRGAQGMSSA